MEESRIEAPELTRFQQEELEQFKVELALASWKLNGICHEAEYLIQTSNLPHDPETVMSFVDFLIRILPS